MSPNSHCVPDMNPTGRDAQNFQAAWLAWLAWLASCSSLSSSPIDFNLWDLYGMIHDIIMWRFPKILRKMGDPI